MADDIDVKQSVVKSIEDMFENVTIWTTPFTVYDFDDYISLTTEPNRPYVFLITRKEPIPELKWSPVVAVSIEMEDYDFQLGSTSQVADVAIYVITRSEGEGTQIARKMRVNMRTISIYDFSGASPVFERTLSYEGNWRQEEIVPPVEDLQEGSLRHWLKLSNTLVVP